MQNKLCTSPEVNKLSLGLNLFECQNRSQRTRKDKTNYQVFCNECSGFCQHSAAVCPWPLQNSCVVVRLGFGLRPLFKVGVVVWYVIKWASLHQTSVLSFMDGGILSGYQSLPSLIPSWDPQSKDRYQHLLLSTP